MLNFTKQSWRSIGSVFFIGISVILIPTVAFAQVPSIVTPTYFCGGSGQGSVCPSAMPTEVLSSGGLSNPPVSFAPSTNPSLSPCSSTVSVQTAHGRGHHHKKQNGAIGNFMQQLLDLIKKLLQEI